MSKRDVAFGLLGAQAALLAGGVIVGGIEWLPLALLILAGTIALARRVQP